MFQDVVMGFEQFFECVFAHGGVIIEQEVIVPLILSFQRFSPSQSHTTGPVAFAVPLNDVYLLSLAFLFHCIGSAVGASVIGEEYGQVHFFSVCMPGIVLACCSKKMTKTLYGLLLAVEAGEDDGDGDASSLCGLCMDGADVAALEWNVHVFTNLWLFSRLSWYEADGFLRYGGVGKGVTPFGGGDVSHLFISGFVAQ